MQIANQMFIYDCSICMLHCFTVVICSLFIKNWNYVKCSIMKKKFNRNTQNTVFYLMIDYHILHLNQCFSKFGSSRSTKRKKTQFSELFLVKLGSNDYGYNKFTAIANKICLWSQIFTLLDKPSLLQRTNIDCPKEFFINEFSS